MQVNYRLTKKLRQVRLILIIILFNPLIILNVNAQKALTLEQCEQIALENNLNIQRQQLVVQSSEKTYKQSFFNLTPNVNTFATANYNAGMALNTATYSYVTRSFYDMAMGVNATITLFNGLRQINTIRQNKFNLKANKEDFERTKNDIRLTVDLLYYQILLNQELLSSSGKQLEITISMESTVKLNAELGRASKSEVLEILAQKSVEHQIVETNENNLKYSYFLLKQVLNYDSISEFEISKPDDNPLDNSVLNQDIDSLYLVSIECLPQTKSADYQLKASKINLSILRGNRSPQLTMTASYGSNYNELAHNPKDYSSTRDSLSYFFREQINTRAYGLISLNLNIPIYSRNTINNRISLARIAVKESEFDLKLAKQQLYQDLQRNWRDAKEAYNRYLSSTETLSYIEEIYKGAEIRFSKGLISTIEYKIAKNNFLNTQSDLLRAKYQYLLSLKNMNYYICK
jgi:outer membrane protein